MNKINSNWIVPIVSMVLLMILSFLLYLDFTTKNESDSLQKLGRIGYKKRDVQRKYGPRPIWEDIDSREFVYNNDWIKTGRFSETTIVLNDGTKIDLDPNTMVVINIAEKKMDIDLRKGSIMTRQEQSKQTDRKINLLFGEKTITLNSGEVGFSTTAENELEIKSYKENSRIDINGKLTRLRKGVRLLFGANRLEYKTTEFSLILPDENKRFLASRKRKRIKFSWEKVNATEVYIIEISDDRMFKNKLITRGTNRKFINLILPQGIYFWRMHRRTKQKKNIYSEIRKFSIWSPEQMVLIHPENKRHFNYSTFPLHINFAWLKNKIALAYQLEISRNRNFAKIIHNRKVYRTRIAIALPAGRYFWKVKALGYLQAFDTESPVHSFSVLPLEGNLEKLSTDSRESVAKEVAAKKTTAKNGNIKVWKTVWFFPRNNSYVDMSKRDYLYFRWKKIPQVEYFEIELFHVEKISKSMIFKTKTTKNYYKFTRLTLLNRGKFICTVKPFFRLHNQIKPGLKTTIRFSITLREKLERPKLIVPNNEN